MASKQTPRPVGARSQLEAVRYRSIPSFLQAVLGAFHTASRTSSPAVNAKPAKAEHAVSCHLCANQSRRSCQKYC